MHNSVYQRIASLQDARLTCIKKSNNEWELKHEEKIKEIIKNYFPHGSGLDYDYKFDYDKSMLNRDVIYFSTSFHAMNDNGYYDSIIDFYVTIKPSLIFGFNIFISGNFGEYQDIKDYLYEVYDYALREIIKNNE